MAATCMNSLLLRRSSGTDCKYPRRPFARTASHKKLGDLRRSSEAYANALLSCL